MILVILMNGTLFLAFGVLPVESGHAFDFWNG